MSNKGGDLYDIYKRFHARATAFSTGSETELCQVQNRYVRCCVTVYKEFQQSVRTFRRRQSEDIHAQVSDLVSSVGKRSKKKHKKAKHHKQLSEDNEEEEAEGDGNACAQYLRYLRMYQMNEPYHSMATSLEPLSRYAEAETWQSTIPGQYKALKERCDSFAVEAFYRATPVYCKSTILMDAKEHYRRQIISLLRMYDPPKVAHVPTLMEQNDGQEAKLLDFLVRLYGPDRRYLDRQRATAAHQKTGDNGNDKNDPPSPTIHTSAAGRKKEEEAPLKWTPLKGNSLVPPEEIDFQPVESSLVFGSSGSFLSVECGCFIHVWKSRSAARSFVAGFQGLWQELFESQVREIACPFTVLFSVHGASVSATTIVPLAQLSPIVPPKVSTPLNTAMSAIQSDTQQVALWEGRDGRFYILDSSFGTYRFRHPQQRSELHDLLVRPSLFTMLRLTKRPMKSDEGMHSASMSDDVLEAIRKEIPAAMTGISSAVKEALDEGVGAERALSKLLSTHRVSTALHQHNINIAFLGEIAVALDQNSNGKNGGPNVALERLLIRGELLARSLVAAVRSILGMTNVERRLELVTDRTEITSHLLEQASACLRYLLTDSDAWYKQMLPILRHKFSLPASFVMYPTEIPLKPILATVATKLDFKLDAATLSFSSFGHSPKCVTSYLPPPQLSTAIALKLNGRDITPQDEATKAVVATYFEGGSAVTSLSGAAKYLRGLCLLSMMGLGGSTLFFTHCSEFASSMEGIKQIADTPLFLSRVVELVAFSSKFDSNPTLWQNIFITKRIDALVKETENNSIVAEFASETTQPVAKSLCAVFGPSLHRVVKLYALAQFAVRTKGSVATAVARLAAAVCIQPESKCGINFLLVPQSIFLVVCSVSQSLLMKGCTVSASTLQGYIHFLKLAAQPYMANISQEKLLQQLAASSLTRIVGSAMSDSSLCASPAVVSTLRSLAEESLALSRVLYPDLDPRTLLACQFWGYLVLKDSASRIHKTATTQEQQYIQEYVDLSTRLHLADETEKRRLIGSEFFVTSAARFAGVLMNNGEWVAGRDLTIISGNIAKTGLKKQQKQQKEARAAAASGKEKVVSDKEKEVALSMTGQLTEEAFTIVAQVVDRMFTVYQSFFRMISILKNRVNSKGLPKIRFREAVKRRAISFLELEARRKFPKDGLGVYVCGSKEKVLHLCEELELCVRNEWKRAQHREMLSFQEHHEFISRRRFVITEAAIRKKFGLQVVQLVERPLRRQIALAYNASRVDLFFQWHKVRTMLIVWAFAKERASLLVSLHAFWGSVLQRQYLIKLCTVRNKQEEDRRRFIIKERERSLIQGYLDCNVRPVLAFMLARHKFLFVWGVELEETAKRKYLEFFLRWQDVRECFALMTTRFRYRCELEEQVQRELLKELRWYHHSFLYARQEEILVKEHRERKEIMRLFESLAAEIEEREAKNPLVIRQKKMFYLQLQTCEEVEAEQRRNIIRTRLQHFKSIREIEHHRRFLAWADTRGLLSIELADPTLVERRESLEWEEDEGRRRVEMDYLRKLHALRNALCGAKERIEARRALAKRFEAARRGKLVQSIPQLARRKVCEVSTQKGSSEHTNEEESETKVTPPPSGRVSLPCIRTTTPPQQTQAPLSSTPTPTASFSTPSPRQHLPPLPHSAVEPLKFRVRPHPVHAGIELLRKNLEDAFNYSLTLQSEETETSPVRAYQVKDVVDQTKSVLRDAFCHYGELMDEDFYTAERREREGVLGSYTQGMRELRMKERIEYEAIEESYRKNPLKRALLEAGRQPSRKRV